MIGIICGICYTIFFIIVLIIVLIDFREKSEFKYINEHQNKKLFDLETFIKTMEIK